MACNGRPCVRCSIASALSIACCIVSGACACVVMLAVHGNDALIARPQFLAMLRQFPSRFCE